MKKHRVRRLGRVHLEFLDAHGRVVEVDEASTGFPALWVGVVGGRVLLQVDALREVVAAVRQLERRWEVGS